MSVGHPGLADRIRAGERLNLLFVKMPAPAEVEQAAAAGVDAVIIDTEHGLSDGLEEHLRAADSAGIPALVRVPGLDPAPILRALDAGACGVVVAHVLDAEGAHAAVSAAHYPPRGRRGLALTTRAGRFGTADLAEHLARAARDTVVIVQIEDAEAVPRAEEILGVDGVSAVLIGSTDLSISLGRPGDLAHPEVRAAITAIEAAARARGVPAAAVYASPATARAARDGAGADGGARADGTPQISVFVAALLIRDAFAEVAGRGAGHRHTPPAGTPLVLLAGMLGTSALWDDVGARLADRVDLRWGRIDLDASIEEMADSVLAAAPARFALAGHSLGAIVALAVVARAPGRVSALALLNSSARPASSEQLAAWDRLEADARDGDFRALADAFARAQLRTARQDDAGQAALAARVRDMALACGPAVLMAQLAAQRGRPDSRPGLGAIACPTLVVSAGEDGICPPERQEELSAAIGGARLERLDGVGHMSPLEAPERVAGLLEAWLGAERPG